MFSNEIIYTIIFFLSIVFIIIKLKPKLLFDENNNFKKFGLNKNETLFNFWIVVILLSIIFNVFIITH